MRSRVILGCRSPSIWGFPARSSLGDSAALRSARRARNTATTVGVSVLVALAGSSQIDRNAFDLKVSSIPTPAWPPTRAGRRRRGHCRSRRRCERGLWRCKEAGSWVLRVRSCWIWELRSEWSGAFGSGEGCISVPEGEAIVSHLRDLPRIFGVDSDGASLHQACDARFGSSGRVFAGDRDRSGQRLWRVAEVGFWPRVGRSPRGCCHLRRFGTARPLQSSLRWGKGDRWTLVGLETDLSNGLHLSRLDWLPHLDVCCRLVPGSKSLTLLKRIPEEHPVAMDAAFPADLEV